MKTLKEWDAKPGDTVTAVSMINTGHMIENGSSWIIKRFDGQDYFGVLNHYKDDHKGIRLSNCHLWEIKRKPVIDSRTFKIEWYGYVGYSNTQIIDGVPQDSVMYWSIVK
jgi:hypothetical protein